MVTPPCAVTSRTDRGFAHTALVVDSEAMLVNRLVPELRRSLAKRERVFVVVGGDAARALRDALGAQADELDWGDQAAFYQRLGAAYEAFRRYLAHHHAAGQRVHVVAEPEIVSDAADDASHDRVAAYLSYEAVCNDTYAEYGSPVTCVWDRRRHPTLVIEGVRSVHNHELTESGRTPNPEFVEPESYLAGRNDIALDAPPPTADLGLTLVDPDDLAALRTEVRGWARRHLFSPAAADDLLLAVSEVAANGLVHGAPPVLVRGWEHRGTLVVQVEDQAGVPLPPAAGYRPPDVSAGPGGRGMWIARQLADSVTTYSGDSRTVVRLYFPYDVTHRRVPDR